MNVNENLKIEQEIPFRNRKPRKIHGLKAKTIKPIVSLNIKLLSKLVTFTFKHKFSRKSIWQIHGEWRLTNSFFLSIITYF